MSDTLVLPLSSNNQTQILRNSSLRGKFFIPTKISDRLSVFLGKEKDTKMTRMDVSREIYKYIRLNNLQDNQSKIIINPDMVDIGSRKKARNNYNVNESLRNALNGIVKPNAETSVKNG